MAGGPAAHTKEDRKDSRVIRRRTGSILPGQREESPERVQRYHLCSECGNIRSARFHKRYPFDREKKPRFNLCESCRVQRVNRGIAQKYHFCFNCGCARSKYFHDRNPILPGEPIVPNYCGICMQEVRADEAIAETSVLGLSPHDKVGRAAGQNSDTEDDIDSLTVHRHRNHRDNRHNNQDTQPARVKASPHKGTRREVDWSPGEKKKAKQTKRPTSLDLEHDSHPANLADNSPVSPYCPSRIIGSASRRAQRKSSGQFDAMCHSRHEKTDEPKNYRAPYIEDSTSTPHSRGRTPDPALLNAGTGQVGEQKTPDVSRHRSCNPGPEPETDDERPRPSSFGRAKDHASNESPRLREKSIESDRSNDSYPNSSKSSSSKTVRFKKSVDIRTTLDPDVDADPSETEIPFGSKGPSRSPSSPLISRGKKPEAYNSLHREEEDNARNYLHPHSDRFYMRSPASFREPLRTPDSYRVRTPGGYSQGAFSKDFRQSDDWGSFKSPKEPHEGMFPGEDSYQGYYMGSTEEPQDFSQTAYTPSHGEQFMESATFAADEARFESVHDDAGSNPYYTPRKRRFPKFSFYCFPPERSEKSTKREDNPPASPGQSDDFFWNNGFNPIPTVEEASSICDSAPEGGIELLEYHIISDSSSIETEEDEEHSDRDFSTSDEDTDESVNTQGKLLLGPALGGSQA
ncbi:hypothetical protein ACJ41O_002415 [Fusarium nematophilum]